MMFRGLHIQRGESGLTTAEAATKRWTGGPGLERRGILQKKLAWSADVTTNRTPGIKGYNVVTKVASRDGTT